MDAVLIKGPCTFKGMPIILKEWNPDFILKKYLLRTLPIWIKLPNFPLQMWGPSSLNNIGIVLGSPIVTDECTTHKLRVSYARVLVEVDVSKKPPEEITIKDKL